MVDYFGELGSSFRDFWSNKALLWPVLIDAVVTWFLAMLFILADAKVVSSLAGAAFNPAQLLRAFLLGDQHATLGVMAALKAASWTPQAIAALVLIILVELVVLLFVSAWFSAGTWQLIIGAVEKRAPSAQAFFEAANSLFGRVILLWLMVLGIGLVAVLVIMVPIGLVAFLGIFSGAPNAVAILLAIPLILLAVALVFTLIAAFLFASPSLIRERSRAGEALRRSYAIFRRTPGHSFLTLLLIIGFAIVVSIALALVFLPVTLTAGFMDVTKSASTGTLVLLRLVNLVSQFFQAILGIILALFLYRMYRAADQASAAARPAASPAAPAARAAARPASRKPAPKKSK